MGTQQQQVGQVGGAYMVGVVYTVGHIRLHN